MYKFRCLLEFMDIGMRKVMDFDNKADARRYAAVCNARILDITPFYAEIEEEIII